MNPGQRDLKKIQIQPDCWEHCQKPGAARRRTIRLGSDDQHIFSDVDHLTQDGGNHEQADEVAAAGAAAHGISCCWPANRFLRIS